MLRAAFLVIASAAGTHSHGGAHSHSPHSHDAHVDVTPNPLTPAAVRFPLSVISIDPSSSLGVSQTRNAAYMLDLNVTRLCCLFTSAANLTGTFEHPTCEPYDHPQYWCVGSSSVAHSSWGFHGPCSLQHTSPCRHPPALPHTRRGHYLGHYLSALAISAQSFGSSTPLGTAMATRITDVLEVLSGVQDAWTAAGEPGFLYPYSPTSFDTLEAGRNCDPGVCGENESCGAAQRSVTLFLSAPPPQCVFPTMFSTSHLLGCSTCSRARAAPRREQWLLRLGAGCRRASRACWRTVGRRNGRMC